MSFLNNVTSLGADFATTPSERRSILLSNAISIVLSSLGFILFIVYYLWYGWSVITITIPVIALLSLSALLFNYLDLSAISRVWICIFLPIATMALSVYSKTVYYDRQEELDYFTFRIIILSCCVLPPVFFSLKEKAYLISTSLFIFLILMLHDPLHNFFDVPYSEIHLKQSNYKFTNVVVMMMYFMMTVAVIFMKWVSEVNESKAQELITELNRTNQKLKDKNNEIEVQNVEIKNQAENLNVSRQKLSDAYKIIEEQRNLLYVQNKNLSTELVEKNQELTETNNELIKHNNELRQFSYTVSHNLRGPVASLMGLLKLFELTGLSEDNVEIFNHIENSTQRLDNIIKDLSKIIDIRNDIFQIRQQIQLDFEVQEILEVLNREIESNNISVNVNLNECAIMYSVRPMVHSILYNLISNAIKYRSPDRKSQINISSREDEKFYYLDVMDNGLGIDLKRDRDNMFRLYKRFHHHTEGKGLGLYLVKLQAEALGGKITVESELNRFTRFTVLLKKPENAERQILYQEEYVEIFYDARLNCLGTLWKRTPEEEEYASVLKKSLDFIKVYNTPNYITDLLFDKPFKRASLFSEIVSEASRNGLRRIAIVLHEDHIHLTEKLQQEFNRYDVSSGTFPTLQEAVEWVETENKKSIIKGR
jgi:signal transduction histidine kinase